MIRRWHRVLALLTALPFLVIVVTGCLLQTKQWLSSLQPKSQKSRAGPLSQPIAWEALLNAVRGGSSAKDWSDLEVVDIRPKLGVARARTRDGFEVQVDLVTGEVLSAAPRYTSWLIELHEGAFFGKIVQNGIFVPSAFALLALAFTGFWLLARHYLKPRRKKRSLPPRLFTSFALDWKRSTSSSTRLRGKLFGTLISASRD